MMRLLIDADGCPDMDQILAMAKRAQVEVVLYCDTAHLMDRIGVRTVTVSQGADAVDFALLSQVTPEDVVLTQDYGLAALVLAKRGKAIHPNGWHYTQDNIDTLLMQRHVSRKARRGGIRVKGQKSRSEMDTHNLLEALSAIMTPVSH